MIHQIRVTMILYEYGWLRPFSKNVDLKENYVPHFYNVFALYCPGTTNYPIKVQVCFRGYKNSEHNYMEPLWTTAGTLHNCANGSMIELGNLNNWNISCNDDDSLSQGPNPFFITESSQIALIQFCDISTVFDSTNIEDILYPNPANDLIVLKNSIENEEYSIINNIGMLVRTGILNANCTIDISDLPPATYYIKTKNKFYKFIKVEK